MFKPLPQGTIGFITQAASRIATTLAVDSALYAAIAATIAGGHHTYLHVLTAGKIEVIKVIEVFGGNSIGVRRGQDNTEREPLLANTGVYYSLTLAAIYDQVRAQVTPITLTATGDATVDPIFAPVMQLESDAALEVVDLWEFADGNYDPCEPYTCPGYVIGPYYLTSQPYPINVIEEIGSYAELWRASLLGAAELEAFESSAELLSGVLTVTVAYETYDKVLEAFDSSAELISGALIVTVGYVTYDDWMNDEASVDKLDVLAELVSGSLPVVVGYITYDHWDETQEQLDSSAELVSGVLA